MAGRLNLINENGLTVEGEAVTIIVDKDFYSPIVPMLCSSAMRADR